MGDDADDEGPLLEAEARMQAGPSAGRMPTEADYAEAALPRDELRRAMARKVLAAGLTLPRQSGPLSGVRDRQIDGAGSLTPVRSGAQESKESPHVIRGDMKELLDDPGAARLRRRRAEQERSMMRRSRRRVAAVAQAVALRGGRTTAGRVVALATALARQPAAAAEAVAAARRSASEAATGMRRSRLSRDAADSADAATAAEVTARAAAQSWRERELAEVRRGVDEALRAADEVEDGLYDQETDMAREHAEMAVDAAVRAGLAIATRRRAEGTDVWSDGRGHGTGKGAGAGAGGANGSVGEGAPVFESGYYDLAASIRGAMHAIGTGSGEGALAGETEQLPEETSTGTGDEKDGNGAA